MTKRKRTTCTTQPSFSSDESNEEEEEEDDDDDESIEAEAVKDDDESIEEEAVEEDDDASIEEEEASSPAGPTQKKINPFLSSEDDPIEKNDDSEEEEEDEDDSRVIEKQEIRKMEDHIVAFDVACKSMVITLECAKAVTSLVDYLQFEEWLNFNDEDTKGPLFLSYDEIALLLLPWAIKHILSSSSSSSANNINDNSPTIHRARPLTQKQQVLPWKTLDACLTRLLSVDEDGESNRQSTTTTTTTTTSTTLQKILTPSTLLKLVPRVALMAIRPLKDEDNGKDESIDEEEGDDNDDDDDDDDGDDESNHGRLRSRHQVVAALKSLRIHASHAYQLLIGNSSCSLYRPTLDVACKTLLLPMAQAMELHELDTTRRVLGVYEADAQERRVLLSTLLLVHKLHFSRKGNPKTTFQLLVNNSNVLLTLARVYLYFQDDNNSVVLSEIEFFPSSNNDNNNNDDADADDGNDDTKNGQSLLCELLDDALFHPQYHMEGFRSLLAHRSHTTTSNNKGAAAAAATSPTRTTTPNSKAGFRCYQEELLACLTSCTSSLPQEEESEMTAENRRQNVCNARDAAWLIPVLLRGFLQNAEEWDRQSRNTTTINKTKASHTTTSSSSEQLLTRLQFHTFVQFSTLLRELISASKQAGNQNVAAVALHSLAETLKLVLKFDAYLPSQDDRERTQYAFLDGIAVELLQMRNNTCLENNSNNKKRKQEDDSLSISQLSDALSGLRQLVHLDHRLLHERLVEVFVFCLQCNDARLHAPVVALLSTVVDTYRQLRQQTHLFHSLLELVERSSQKDDGLVFGVNLQLFASHLEDPTLTTVMAEAIQTCPVLQVTETFAAIGSGIRNFCDSNRPDINTNNDALAVIVRLSILVARNVRVEGGTAAEVALVCQSMVENSVADLARHGRRDLATDADGNNTMTKASLTLCGWYLDLHARCAFWLGGKSQLAIPEQIMATLKTAIKELAKENRSRSSREPTEFDDMAEELLFLACHRLRQVHSLIYEQERLELENESTAGKRLSESYTSEAFDLATFAVTMATRQRNTTTSSSTSQAPQKSHWTTIAENFAAWAPYSTVQHLDLFLNWFFSVLSIDPSSSSSLPPDSMAYRKECQGIDEDTQCAKALVRDASFYESKNVLNRFGMAALSCCADWVSWALTDCTTGDSIEDRELASLAHIGNGSDQIKQLDAVELVRLSQSSSFIEPVSEDQRPTVVSKLKQALRPIMVLNGLAVEVYSLEDAMAFILSSIRLDHVCWSLADCDKILLPNAMQLSGGLRLSIAWALSSVLRNKLNSDLGINDQVHVLISAFAVSAIEMTSRHDALDSLQAKSLLNGTSALLRQLSSYSLFACKSKDELGDSIGRVVEHDQCQGFQQQRAVAILSRSFLDALSPGSVGDVGQHKLSTTVRNHLWKVVLSVQSGCRETGDPSEMILLFGDLLRFSSTWKLDSWPDEARKDGLVSTSITRLLSEGDVNVKKALSYLVATVSQCSPTPEVSQYIIEKVVDLKAADPLLDASFCRLIGTATTVTVKMTLQALISSKSTKVGADEATSRLRLLRLLLIHIDREAHGAVTAESGSEILTLALSQLHTCVNDEPSAQSAVQACSVLEELIRRRDVLIFRERDLARVLSHVSAVTGPGDGGTNDNMKPLPNIAFVACTQLFMLMFQRYTNLLYACAPSVILALHSFLDRVLYDEDVTDDEVSERGQHFTRVCELLIAHKDIYKKHLLGPLQEFVRALQVNLNVVRKQSVLPAIYCLLDSLSTYEMKQLNALMDPKGKILFRTVYESYQKLHAYKGR